MAEAGGRACESAADVRVVGWIRLDNATELARRLRLTGDRRGNHADIVAAAWRAWGEDALTRLVGDFSFVLVDGDTVLAARDRLGVRPLFFTHSRNGVGFASSVAGCAAMPGVASEVDSDWIMRFLVADRSPTSITPVPGVVRVMPAERVLLRRLMGSPSVSTWHRFDLSCEDTPRRSARWPRRYRDAFLEAVANRLPPQGAMGFESSGGLDSSSIVAAAARVSQDPHRLHTLTRAGIPEQDAQAALLHRYLDIPVPNEHILRAGDAAADGATASWRVLGYPAEHPNATSHVPFYLIAREYGMAALHSGHGGDDGVTSAATPALHEVARQWPVRGTWRLARPGPGRGVRAARLTQLKAEREPPPRSWTRKAARMPVRSDAVARYAEAWDQAAKSTVTVNEFLVTRRLPLVALRTEECSSMAAAFGLSYEWPLLDSPLVQTYLHSPAVWKNSDGFGRYLHRRAMAGLLPDRIRWDPRKLNTLAPVRAKTPDRQLPNVLAARFAELRADLHPALVDVVDLGDDRIPNVDPAALRRATTLNAWLRSRDSDR